jgi:NAD(P)-dependent dehydrogenase (short-subunit alcohol dehydrogenase family)
MRHDAAEGNTMQLSGRVALVTGGGGGIGAGIAEALIEHGARVALTDINPDYAQAEADRLGQGTIALHHDVTSLKSWANVVAAVEAECAAPIDVLCNNAGISLPFKLLEEVSETEFARVMAINVTGVFNGCKALIPDMKARGRGHIVNTSSLNGLIPHGTFAAYSASKFAVAGMSEALRIELEPFGIGVSILYPGLTRSRMSENQMADLSPDMAMLTTARMMDAVWLGRAVARAIEGNEQHIITHPAHRDVIAARQDAVLAAHGEPAQPGYA